MAGAIVLSARFQAWAKSNGPSAMLADVAIAKADYEESGARSSYAGHSPEELQKAYHKAIDRVDRITAEKQRREEPGVALSSGGGSASP